MKAMSRIGDLLILNFLFLLTCLPFFTIGAASSAMYTVCFRFGTDRESGLLKSYFIAFRDNFKQSTALWLVILFCGCTAFLNTYLFYLMPGAIRYAFILFAILFVLVLLLSAYAFPLVSQFNNHVASTLRNALILSLAYLPRSVLIVALNVFPFALIMLDLYTFLQAGFIWIVLYFSAAAYINTFMLRKVFAPYMPSVESEKEDTQ